MISFKRKIGKWGIVVGASGWACFSLPAWGEEAVDPSVQKLLQQLEERDRLIADLQRRVSHLERLVQAKVPSPATQASKQTEQLKAGQVAQAQLPQPEKPKPGAFEVDEEAAERALERTLTQVGALLIPFSQAELQPFFTYTRQELDTIVLAPVAGQVQLGKGKVRINRFDSGVFSRLGLPWDSQLEFRIPYALVDQSRTNFPGLGAQASEFKDSGSHLSDIQLGFAKTLFREKSWRPDLIARLTWTAPTGRSFDDKVALGGGFHRLRGEMTMLKRQDPLAFRGTFFYEGAFDENNDNPGDQFGFDIGAFLAASPETSLSISLQQTFIDKIKINGHTIRGSDRVISAFVFGASTIIAKDVLVSVFGGIGLTKDSPDYFVNISVPVRFGVPFVK
jgi:hypothetical protein